MAGLGRFYIYTFGCQMNERDSQIMARMLAAEGMTPAASPDEAQLVVLNTCHIREHADQRALSLLGRLKPWRAGNPGRILVMAGCVAEALHDNLFLKFPHLDIVVGPSELLSLPELVRSARHGSGGKQVAVGHGGARHVPELDDGFASGYKASVKVMEGCGHKCTFCVVPGVRGPARSRPFNEIVSQAERLAEAGVKEISLLGQAVNAYRDGRAESGDFTGLLRRLDLIGGLLRIRFISSHPAHMNEGLFRAMAECGKICEHVHLPVQSGSDEILKRMRRGYTAAAYLDLLEKARKIVPDVAFTTDIIVGFPGETEEDFLSTLELVRSAGLDAAFAFKYSPRPGTPAREMPGQITEAEKEERLARLNRLLDAESRARNDSLIGRDGEILVDSVADCGKGCNGRLRNNKLVHTEGPMEDVKPGDLIRIIVVGAGGYSLRGRPAAEMRA